MNIVQVVALIVFVCAMVLVYGRPLLSLIPVREEKSPELMDHIEQVVGIRGTYRQPEVVEACNALLRVLLGVKQ